MQCGKNYLYLSKHIGDRFYFAFVPARCKSWACETCRRIKSKIVREYIKANFETDDTYMITLTFFHSGSVESCWEQLGARWNRLRSYVQKMSGKFTYIRVVEPHKKGGWPHMHILVRNLHVSEKFMSMITKWGFGWNAHCVRMSTKDAADYVAKYLEKPWPDNNADYYRAASKTRIVCVSQDLPPVFAPRHEWEVLKYDVPGKVTLYLCNYIIHYLLERQATIIRSQPVGPGFLIESDLPVWINEISDFPVNVWKRVDESYEYDWFPYGLQEILNL